MAQQDTAFDSPDFRAWFDRRARLMCARAWTDDAKAELHLLGMNLHNLSVELSRQHACAATILEGYAIRIDELMKRAPEVVS